jgi:tetratricopeptide (TPR) repeat protein
MKMFCSRAARTLLFLSLSISAAGVSAQKINEDLQTPKSTARKTVKPVQKQVKKKPVRIVKKSKTSTNQTTAVVPPVAQPAVTQTPAEIMKRFMDFQQSAGVTEKDWESVVAQTNASLQTNPADATMKAQLFVAQGQLAFMRGDFSNALIQFNAASDALPDSALPPYGIGKVYLATKQPNEAENAFEKAVKNDKNFALAYKGIGDALTAQGKTKRAQDFYKDAARIGLSGGSGVVAQNNQAGGNQVGQTNVPNVNLQTSPYETDLNEAKKLTARKKWQASLDKLTALSKTNPTADIYVAIGDNYMGLRQLLSAQQAFRKATEINSNSAVGFFKLGSALFELNEFQAASEAFEKSLILDQQGTTINRSLVRKLADRASERAKNSKEGKKKFLGIGLF